MHNLAKKKTTFLQDIPFISTCFIINTSKCKILRKRKRLFLQDIPFIVKKGDRPVRLPRACTVCFSLLKWLKTLSQKL